MFHLRDLPTPPMIRSVMNRYPQVDPTAAEASLVLLRVGSDLVAAVEEYLRRQDMSQGRFTVMMLLNREPEKGFCPSDLADKAGVTRATVTGLIDTLERDGLVRRQSDCEDRRMMTVHLTPRGREYLDRRLPDYFRRQAAVMSALSEPERQQLVQILHKIREHIPSLLESPAAEGK